MTNTEIAANSMLEALQKYAKTPGYNADAGDLGMLNGMVVSLVDVHDIVPFYNGLKHSFQVKLQALRNRGVPIDGKHRLKDLCKALDEYLIGHPVAKSKTEAVLSDDQLDLLTIEGRNIFDSENATGADAPSVQEKPTTTATTLHLSDDEIAKNQSIHIKKRLRSLKKKHRRNFKNIKKLTETTIDWIEPGLCKTSVKGGSTLDDYFNYIFRNKYTKHAWHFIENKKIGHIKEPETGDRLEKSAFYFSDIIAFQFKKISDTHRRPLVLPKCIYRESIENPETILLLRQNRENYTTLKFAKAFLKDTDNGKSTVRVAEDFGLDITGLTVQFYGTTVTSVELKKLPSFLQRVFSIIVHVIPSSLEQKESKVQ